MTEWTAETAEWYAEKYGEYATNRLAVDEIELAPEATSVVDGRLIGIDPVPRMLEIARERAAEHPGGERIEFRQGAAETLPLENGEANVVLALDSIDHWQDRERGLGEVRRVLAHGGRFVVVKDRDAPGGRAASEVHDELEDAGFRVHSCREIDADAVRFTLWICKLAG